MKYSMKHAAMKLLLLPQTLPYACKSQTWIFLELGQKNKVNFGAQDLIFEAL